MWETEAGAMLGARALPVFPGVCVGGEGGVERRPLLFQGEGVAVFFKFR